MIEDLEGESLEVSPPRVVRPRVSSEPIIWAFLSAIGAGFIANGIVEIGLAVLWPMLFPPTEPQPGWVTPFAIGRAAELVAIGAVALRAGGVPAVALSAGYEVALVLVQLPNRIAICERLGPVPDPFLVCGLPAIAAGTWPTWVALLIGMVGSRQLLPPPRPGANTLLRAAGAFTLALAVAAIAWDLGQSALYVGLAAVGGSTPTGRGASPFQVAISTMFLFVELVAGFLAGLLLRGAPSAAVVLLALLIGYGVGAGVAQIVHNVETGVPHAPFELAYLQSMRALTPAAGILGIALGRLVVRRPPVVPERK